MAFDVTDTKLQKAVVAAVKRGEKFQQIAEENGIDAGQAKFVYAFATEPHDIKGKTDVTLGRAIAKARDKENASWVTIRARAKEPSVARVQKLYREATGSDPKASSIGKGGRPVGSKNGSGKAAEKSPAPAKKTTGRKQRTASKNKSRKPAADKAKAPAKKTASPAQKAARKKAGRKSARKPGSKRRPS